MRTSTKYKDLVKYAEEYWREAHVSSRSSAWGNLRNILMHIARIKLPHRAVSPNHRYFAGTQFYWDTYFTVIGLLIAGQKQVAREMVDNLCSLFPKFGLVPARNSWLSLGRTQPPYLTRMAWEIFESKAAERDWLDRVMAIAEKEYKEVWQRPGRYIPELGLNRYQPKYLRRLLTVYESGWDTSSRFAGFSDSIVPVDLNCLLYFYEVDLARWHRLSKRHEEAKKWAKLAQVRKDAINHYLWDEDLGFYFDYHIKKEEKLDLKTLAGFYPLWCGLATQAQADKTLRHLSVFEQPHGLANTEKLPRRLRQWDYPNGWPPLQLIVIDGLYRYGYRREAAKWSHKWLRLNQRVLRTTGQMWEKYDVVHGKEGLRGRYPTQPGFAWTCGVALKILDELGKN